MNSEEEFDRFLAGALAPPEREEDHAFVVWVQQRIRIDDALRAARVAALERLSVGIVALGAVAAALVWLARSTDAAAIAAESPAPVLAGLILLFMSVVWLVAPGASPAASGKLIRAIPAA